VPVLISLRCHLLLGPRFGRHQAVDPVIDDKLAIVFSGMLDQSVGQVIEPSQRRPARSDSFIQTLVTLRLDDVGAVLNALFTKATIWALVCKSSSFGSSGK